MSKTTWLASIATLLIIGGVIAISYSNTNTKIATDTTVTPVTTTTPTSPVVVLPYGKTSLKMDQTAVYSGVSVKFLRVTEDSRCPQGVQCIWAGTFKAEIQIASNLGTSTQVLELGKFIIIGPEIIRLVAVVPYPNKSSAILAKDYSVTFEVTKPGASTFPSKPVVRGACYIGGCSAELCTDKSGAVSSCMYRSEFACYKQTKCERQASGQCGWTQTTELSACLLVSQK